MDNHGAAQDICYLETLVIKCFPGVSLAGEQGEQVAGMLGMAGILRVVMSAGVRKALGAVAVLVNVHGIEVRRTPNCLIGQIEEFCFDKDAAIRRAVKLNKAACRRGIRVVCDPGHGLWPVLLQYGKKDRTWSRLLCLHKEPRMITFSIILWKEGKKCLDRRVFCQLYHLN